MLGCGFYVSLIVAKRWSPISTKKKPISFMSHSNMFSSIFCIHSHMLFGCIENDIPHNNPFIHLMSKYLMEYFVDPYCIELYWFSHSWLLKITFDISNLCFHNIRHISSRNIKISRMCQNMLLQCNFFKFSLLRFPQKIKYQIMKSHKHLGLEKHWIIIKKYSAIIS